MSDDGPNGVGPIRADRTARRASSGTQRVMDRRAAAGWRRRLIRDLGGAAALSEQQRTIVAVAERTRLHLMALDAWLGQQPTVIDPRRRAVLPALRERTALADLVLRCLRALGLERRREPADVTSYLATRYAAAPVAPPPTEPQREED